MSVWLLLASLAPEPRPRPEFDTGSPTPYIMLFLAGFLVGILGHLFRSRTMVLIGVLAVFAGTVVLPLWVYISKSS